MKHRTAFRFFLAAVSAGILAESASLRHDIIKNRDLVISLTHNADKTLKNLYTENSLRNAGTVLENKLLSIGKTMEGISKPDPYTMTGKVLYLIKKHGLNVTDYRLSGTRLKIKTNGKAEGTTGLIYDLSFPAISKTGGRLTFMSARNEPEEGTITLTAEISCE